MEYAEDDFIQLSALQHVVFCPRQCFLIHTERLWTENYFTAAGQIFHSRADDSDTEYPAPGIRLVHSLLLRSVTWGISGRADAVEFNEKTHRIFPVEFKVGKPKESDCDLVQLCAQAFCLEEMLNTSISEGAVYYGKTRHRMNVALTDELRGKTVKTVQFAHNVIRSPKAPEAVWEKSKCSACSLCDFCMPKLKDLPSPEKYLESEMDALE